MSIPEASGGTLLATIASSSAGANVTATKNGYICGVYYTVDAGGILKGKVRDSNYPTYGTSFYVDQLLWAGEPFFCLPVRKDQKLAVNVSGHSEVKIYQF